MSNPRTLDRAILADFAKSAAKAIAEGKITGFTPEQNLTLSAALENEAAPLAAANEKAVASVAQAHTDVGKAQDQRFRVLDMLTAYKFAMRGVKATSDQYKTLGFDPPATWRHPRPGLPIPRPSPGLARPRLRMVKHSVGL
jgi:hypothetical protein